MRMRRCHLLLTRRRGICQCACADPSIQGHRSALPARSWQASALSRCHVLLHRVLRVRLMQARQVLCGVLLRAYVSFGLSLPAWLAGPLPALPVPHAPARPRRTVPRTTAPRARRLRCWRPYGAVEEAALDWARQPAAYASRNEASTGVPAGYRPPRYPAIPRGYPRGSLVAASVCCRLPGPV